ncbi:hypothetical protein XENTR_v10016990 [Xenopus tropicalis]|uniref:Vexin n=1 Tax=Xenopus tropicalis TaxID=8364 RepID=A0A6I8RAZ1_XENTR|nr:vexin [Xenopus tropicalis]KAE8598918.1 hypothetical protein XENTR_v10016990 [Xenopus tropicalis]|eukprot:XP_002935358.1 PREDICTED: uncharacterized protein C8orf46 homolog [Xenopus tropicalis]
MIKLHRQSYKNLQNVSTASPARVCKSSKGKASAAQKTHVSRGALSCDAHPHLAQELVAQQVELLQVLHRNDEMWRLAVQDTTKHIQSTEKKTSRFSRRKQSVQPKTKSLSTLPAYSTDKQNAPTVPASPINYETQGCREQRPQIPKDEATLPLTAQTVPKKTPSLLEKIGLKLKRTVEYIGASNCAFEDD